MRYLIFGKYLRKIGADLLAAAVGVGQYNDSFFARKLNKQLAQLCFMEHSKAADRDNHRIDDLAECVFIVFALNDDGAIKRELFHTCKAPFLSLGNFRT